MVLIDESTRDVSSAGYQLLSRLQGLQTVSVSTLEPEAK